ncbi:MAG: hypothetical protein OXT74_06770 [Candidatus Poribacteria bacterium]|nr:hypothetical protein [Candidatus Poribacteria bacterium]
MSENWVNGLASKVDELIVMVREINVHLKYSQERLENQCERIVRLEDCEGVEVRKAVASEQWPVPSG